MPTKLLLGVILLVFLYFPLTIYLWRKTPVLVPGLLILLIGIFSNVAVTCANGYKMPVVVFSGDTTNITDENHCEANKDTKLIFLSDHIHVSSPFFNVGYVFELSIGDILIGIGCCMLFVYCALYLMCLRFPAIFSRSI